MTRRSLVAMAALVPGVAAAANSTSAPSVEAISAALRSSNVEKGKVLLEIAWSRPAKQSYHGAVIEARIGTAEPVVLVRDLPDGSHSSMAVVDATELVARAKGMPIRVVARPVDASGEVRAYRAGVTPEIRVPRRSQAA